MPESTNAGRCAADSPDRTGNRPDNAATGVSRPMLNAGTSAAISPVTEPSKVTPTTDKHAMSRVHTVVAATCS